MLTLNESVTDTMQQKRTVQQKKTRQRPSWYKVAIIEEESKQTLEIGRIPMLCVANAILLAAYPQCLRIIVRKHHHMHMLL